MFTQFHLQRTNRVFPGLAFACGVLWLILPSSVRGVDFYPPYTWCDHWGDGAGPLDDDSHGCNEYSGAVAAYAAAWAGAATAEASQTVVFYVGSEKDIALDATVWRSGGAITYGFGAFAGTEKIWSVDGNDGSSDLDPWWGWQTAVQLSISLVTLAGGGQYQAVSDAVSAMNDIYSWYNLFHAIDDYGGSEDVDEFHIVHNFHALPGWHTVSVGMRATTSGAVTGTGLAFTTGQIVKITIWGMDPPDQPAIWGGPDFGQGDTGIPYDFTAGTCDPDGDAIEYRFDWGDGQVTGWMAAPGDCPELTMWHTYDSGGLFEVRVQARDTDYLESLWSPPRVVDIHEVVPPPGDDCTEALVIGDGHFEGSNVDANRDGSAGCENPIDPGPDVWYEYSTTCTGTLYLDTCGAVRDLDTVLSVHTACPGSPLNEVDCNDECSWPTCGDQGESCLSFAVNQDETYLLRVSGYDACCEGDYSLRVRCEPPPPGNDDALNAVPITDGTHNGTTAWATNDGTASCGASDTGADVWYAYTAECSGYLHVDACGSLYDTVVSVQDDLPGPQAVEVACNNDCVYGSCGDPDNPAPESCLIAPVDRGGTYYIRVSGFAGQTGDFTLNVWADVFPPANDQCVNAGTILRDGWISGTTCGASPDGTATCGDSTGSPDVWYKYTSDTYGHATVNTCMSDFDTVLSVHTDCPGSGTEMVCNDYCPGSPCGPEGSCIGFDVEIGTTYFIRVSGVSGDYGDFTLDFDVDAWSMDDRVAWWSDSGDGLWSTENNWYIEPPLPAVPNNGGDLKFSVAIDELPDMDTTTHLDMAAMLDFLWLDTTGIGTKTLTFDFVPQEPQELTLQEKGWVLPRGRLFWSILETDGVDKADLDTSDIAPVTTVVGNPNPDRLAFDFIGGRVYEVISPTINNAYVRHCDPDGLNDCQNIISTGGSGYIGDIAIMQEGGQICWTQGNAINSANLDGTGVTEIISPSSLPGRIDVGLGYVYWLSGDELKRTLTSTPVEETIYTHPGPALIDVVVDTLAYQVVFTDGDAIYRCYNDGSQLETLVTGANIRELAVDELRGHEWEEQVRPHKMYWVQRPSGAPDELWRANSDGTNPELLKTFTPDQTIRGLEVGFDRSVAGRIELNGGRFNFAKDFWNYGEISGPGGLDGGSYGDLKNRGMIRAPAGGLLDIYADTIANLGTIHAEAGSVVTVDGYGQFDFHPVGTIVVDGELRILDSWFFMDGGLIELNGGLITGQRMDLWAGSEIVGYGQIAVSAEGWVPGVYNNGRLNVQGGDLEIQTDVFEQYSSGEMIVPVGTTLTVQVNDNPPRLDLAGTTTIGGSLDVPGTPVYADGQVVLDGGTVSADAMWISTGTGTISGSGTLMMSEFRITDGTADFVDDTVDVQAPIFYVEDGVLSANRGYLTCQDLSVGYPSGSGSGYIDASPRGTFEMTGDFRNASTQNTLWNTFFWTPFGLPGTTFRMNGSGSPADPQLFEVSSADLGPTVDGVEDNFAIHTIEIGPNITTVSLVDFRDNAAGQGAEAVYVRKLVLNDGLTLILNGYNVYYVDLQQGTNVTIDGSAGGALVQFTGAAVCTGTCGDIDGNGIVNLTDFAAFAACFGMLPSVSQECACSDLDQNGLINLVDFATFAQLFGGSSTNTPPNCL